MRLTDHHVAETKRQLKPNISPHYLTVKAEIKQLGVIHMTVGRTWTVEQDIPDRSTDREDVPRHAMMAIYSGMTNLATPEPITADGPYQS